MIISFKNINGGGGGGYVLPTATANRLGGVMIGQGINVDSAGTISVTGGTIEEMPISPFMSKDLNANGRCFSKEVEFQFEISWDDSGQKFNNYKFNPYLDIKQLNGRNWNQSSYLDIYITKGEQDEYPTFKLVNGYNIGQGFVSEKLIEETLNFNIGIEGESNQVEFDIRDFLLRADSRYGSQDYTVKGLKVEIISDGMNRVGLLKFKMDSDDNQTFLNYLTLPNDAYGYNVHIFQTFATTQGHYPIATNSNVGMVQIGTGFTYSNNNGVLSVPTASKNETGIVMIGDGLDIDENGVLSDKDDVKVVSELPTTSVTETIGSIWYGGQEQTGDFTCKTEYGGEIGFRKGNTNPQENITLLKIESYQKYTTLELTPDGTYIVTDESGTKHYLSIEGDFLEISGTMVTYTFAYNYGGANETLTITLSEDKEIEDVYVDTPVTKVLAVGDEGDIAAMVDASENLCFYEIVNQEWSEKYAHSSGGTGGGIEVVSQLPASGTDGQVVMLLNSEAGCGYLAKQNKLTIPVYANNKDTYGDLVYVNKGISVTEKTKIIECKQQLDNLKIYLNTDGGYGLSVNDGEEVIVNSETTAASLTFNSVQLNPRYSDGNLLFKIGTVNTYWRYIYNYAGAGNEIYVWNDESKLVANINFGVDNSYNLRYITIDYKQLPSNSIYLGYVLQSFTYYHYFIENESVVVKGYNSDDYTTGTLKSTYTLKKCGGDINMPDGLTVNVKWYDNTIYLVAKLSNSIGNNLGNNIVDQFTINGWLKPNINCAVNTYKQNYTGGGSNAEVFNFDGTGRLMSTLGARQGLLTVNGVQNYYFGMPMYGLMKDYTVYAPSTTGQTGYVCVAGSGNTAPTWKNPSTLLNKSTLYGTHSTFIVATDDWKLLDSSSNNTFGAGNFYIYNTCDYNVTTEIVDFNDITDNGEGGMTEPTKELKVSANTDGSYDVFYGEFIDYKGGLYSYTASTHLDTVFSDYTILTEDQTGNIVRIILRPDGLYCYENYSGCGFVNNSYSTFGVGDSVTIGKMTVFVHYEDTPTVFLSQPEE